MAFLTDAALDAGLNVVRNASSPVLHICTSEPTTRSGALSASVGNKTSPSFGSLADRVASGGGRRFTVAAFSDGSVTGNGTATHWAIIDGTSLLAASSLVEDQAVVSGNTFSLAAFDVGIPDAV